MPSSENESSLFISASLPLTEIQKQFNDVYPYLKIEFYKKVKDQLLVRTDVMPFIQTPGTVTIFDSMTIDELEKMFLEEFGLIARISRQAIIWMEIPLTGSWTLKQQN